MIISSTLIILTIARAINMSILQRLFKRKAKRSTEQDWPTKFDFTYFKDKSYSPDSRIIYDQICEKAASARETRTDTPIDAVNDDPSEDDVGEHREQDLNLQVNQLKKHEERLKRRQMYALQLEEEIQHVLTLLALAKRQNTALDEEILNKKCELLYLASEVPVDYAIEARKKEPYFYKKYSNVVSVSDANNVLVIVRQKMKALHYIELLTYNKYIECQHNLKSSHIRRRSNALSKNKKRHFGHLAEASAENGSSTYTWCNEQATDAMSLHGDTIVTIEPRDDVQSPWDLTSSTIPPAPPAPPAPSLPANYFRVPLSLTAGDTMATETVI